MTFDSTITAWVIEQLARELHIDPAEIDPSRPVIVYGLDSLTAAALAADLEDRFGLRLPEDGFREGMTILDIGRLAVAGSGDRPLAAAATAAQVDYGALDYSRWAPAQRVLQRCAALLVRALYDVHVESIERAAAPGPLILASNHLHILDALLLFSVLPRRTVFLAAEEFRRRPLVGWLLRFGQTIFVTRGAGDRGAIARALLVLESGGCVAIAPEGRLSRTGGLLRGLSGVARLATGSGAPVIPVAMHGHERAARRWRRGRRPPVHIRFAEPVRLARAPATARQLEVATDTIMTALARALPPEYRGYYLEASQASPPAGPDRP